MPDLIEPIRQVIEDHRPAGDVDDRDASCRCGVEGISDHPRHVAEQIIDRLGLKPANMDDVRQQIRYATAWFDWELTKLEGAEC
ncbi:hypothetical protein [Mycobacterium sp.]|uniref:hypothetical protein n=1 Tax=Mycobacterium sp. TaxID=1785 RepID=UPI003F9BFB76